MEIVSRNREKEPLQTCSSVMLVPTNSIRYGQLYLPSQEYAACFHLGTEEIEYLTITEER